MYIIRKIVMNIQSNSRHSWSDVCSFHPKNVYFSKSVTQLLNLKL